MLSEFGLRSENVLLVYVIAVLIVNMETKSLAYGFASAVICVLTFNYFFTDPMYTMVINDANYYVSIIIFVFVSAIANMLVSRLQKQIKSSRDNEEQMQLLFEISKSFLKIHSAREIVAFEQSKVEDIIGQPIVISLKTEQGWYYHGKVHCDVDEKKLTWTVSHMVMTGWGKKMFSATPWKMIPFSANKKALASGVMLIDCREKEPDKKAMRFVDTSLNLMTLVLEHELLAEESKQANVRIEKEKLRSSLLLGIAHDIRTPLTGIAAGSSLLLESFDEIDEDEKTRLLNDINSETNYLSQFVNNLLNVAKIEANRLTVSKTKELVDDLISVAVEQVGKQSDEHTINVNQKNELIFVYCEPKLLVQVIVNLLKNAFEHTPPGTTVEITYHQKMNNLIMEIADDGGGIANDKLDAIFEGVFSRDKMQSKKSRGFGIGLNVCKGIIEAHGGTISAVNNKQGGATFIITLPNEKGRS